MEEIPKPAELLAARGSAQALFRLVRAWFHVPENVTLDLRSVDSATTELADPQYVVAMTLRKLQSLHQLATPGVRTTTDAVLTLIQDLERALLQTPGMLLSREAEATDWDAALQALDEDGDLQRRTGSPAAGGGEYADELEVFRHHQQCLRDVARAVLHASDGQSRILV